MKVRLVVIGAALGVVGALSLGGCGDGPVGGWKSTGSHVLYACFSADGTARFDEDKADVVDERNVSKWSDDGSIEGFEVPEGTTWKLDGDELVMNQPCSLSECPPTRFRRDDSLNCK